MSEFSPRPAHLISRDEVAAWLADSAVKVVTYHRTSDTARRRILREGILIGASQVGAFGLGFYSATVGDPFSGDVEIAVAVRLRTPLIGTASDLGELIDRLAKRFSPLDPRINREVGRRIRRELMEQGYDGMIVRDAGGHGVDSIIAFEGAAVRVVVDW